MASQVPSDVEKTTKGEFFGPRAKLRRHAERGRYDPEEVFAVVDAAPIAHLAFVLAGQAHCIPLAHGRVGRTVYLHGAVANRALKALQGEQASCLVFTLLDGLVCATRAFNHSMNFRCAVVFGQARELTDPEELGVALSAIVDHNLPGRTQELPPHSEQELAMTRVVAVDITEASVKVRSGGTGQPAETIPGSPNWVGTLPLALVAGGLQRDPALQPETLLDPSIGLAAVRYGANPVIEQRDGEWLYSTDDGRLDVDWIAQLLTESYWAKGVSRAAVSQSLTGSLCFGLYEGGRQVAFARVVSDGCRIGYVADVIVDPGRQRCGLGTKLMNFVLAHPQVAKLSRLVLATRDADGFYERCGFKKGANVHLSRLND